MTMTTLAARAPPATARLDCALLRRAFFVIAMVLSAVAPFSPNPIEFAAGAFLPWLILRIVGTPTLPAAIVFYLLWQWMQIYARVWIGLIDDEAMDRGLFGPWVLDAYWYMMASLVTLALAIRIMMGGLRPPTPRQMTAHLEWRTTDLLSLYIATFLVASAARFLGEIVGALDQPMEAVSRIKIIALFILFAGVLATGRGMLLLVGVLLLELVVGFSGLLGDFRGVFIFLFVAALAVRIRWTGRTAAVSAAGTTLLVLLALFWTSVKAEFREFATLSDDSQNIKTSFDARMNYLGTRAFSPGGVDWSQASYALLNRLAYVDIFGSVIGVKNVSAEQGSFRQWSDAVFHVFQPRFLFPDKVNLSDTEVFVRLARADATEQVRLATSISVGYLAENYVDFGFPAMLGSVFLIGLIIGGVCRYFAMMPAPWVVHEGTIMAFLYSIGSNGVEISLPKLLGATMMFFVVYALLARFVFPVGLRLLDTRAAAARQTEKMR